MHSSGPFNVLHVALLPMTGVWTLMRELATAQRSSGNNVAFGVYVNGEWSTLQRSESRQLPWPVYTQDYPAWNGSYLTLLFRNNIIEWVHSLQRDCPHLPTVVHFHSAWISGAFFPLFRKWPKGVGWVVTVHGIHPTVGLYSWKKRIIWRWLLRRMARRNGLLTTVDWPNTQLLREYFGLDPANIHLVPNGLCDNVQPDQAFRSLRTNTNQLLIGFVGVLSPTKGWRIAVDAVTTLVSNGNDCRLVLVGTGPDRAEVEALARELPYLTFLGELPQAGRRFIPHLDVLVLPSSSEGQPMVILEAMAAGVPVVATRVAGIPALIEDGKTGFLINRSPDAVAEAIGKLIDSNLLAELKKASREKFLHSHEIGGVALQYGALYQRATDCARIGRSPGWFSPAQPLS